MLHLLQLGGIDALSSIGQILLFALLGAAFNETKLVEGFIIGFPMQFVAGTLYAVVYKGSVAYSINEKKDKNYILSAMSVHVVITGILVALIYLFRYQVTALLGYSYEYTPIVMFSAANVAMDYTVFMFTTQKELDGQLRKAFQTQVLYHTCKYALVLVSCMIDKSQVQQTLIELMLFSCVFICVIWEPYTKVSKFQISLQNYFKYSSMSIVSRVSMFIIYVLGIKWLNEYTDAGNMFLSIASMCTDTQWDILGSAIDTDIRIKLRSNKYYDKLKEQMFNCLKYSFMLWASSIVLFIMFTKVFVPIDLNGQKIVFLMITFEGVGMVIDSFNEHSEAYLQIKHPTKHLIMIKVAEYAVRMLIQTAAITSIYCTHIGMIASLIFALLITAVWIDKVRKDKKLLSRT